MSAMKITLFAGLLFLAGCGHRSRPLLTSPGPIVKRGALQCAVINEWDITDITKDPKKKNGCWCLLPPVMLMEDFPIPMMFYRLTFDEACDPNISMKDLAKKMTGLEEDAK